MDGQVVGVSSEADHFLTLGIPPVFTIFDPPAMLDPPAPMKVHEYLIDHNAGIAYYQGIS